MRRTILAAVILSAGLLPGITQAQTSPSGGSTRGVSIARPGAGQTPPPPPAPPSRQTPSGPLVPLAPPSAPPIGPFASPSALDRDIFRAGPRTFAPRFNRFSRRNQLYGYGVGYGYGAGYVADPFGYISQPESGQPQLDRYMRQEDAIGYLRLDVEPETGLVYVDGFYAGTVADFRRSGGRALESGPHRIEIRAEGFDSQSVELRIRANDVLSYRGTLTRRDDSTELRAAVGTPKTFYVIPRCYAGTSRPRAEQLPPGCRLNDLRTVPPVVGPTQ